MFEIAENEKILLISENGNGYHCGCCRKSSLSYEVYNSVEELLSQLDNCAKDDFAVRGIFKIIDSMEFGYVGEDENNSQKVAAHLRAI